MNQLARTSRPAPSRAVSLPVPASEPVLADSLLNFVARAMADPAIDAGKLEMLLRMQREIVADDARLQFNRAMSAAQGEMVAVVRDATNDQTKSRYARLETIDAAIRPIYVRHGFCLTFNSEQAGTDVRIVCKVAHVAGHTERYQLDAAADVAGPQGKANKTPLHGLGSTVSYLRRYLTCMIFNVVLSNEDTDGNRARETAPPASRDQLAELRALIAACSADPDAEQANEAAFLRRMGVSPGLRLADAPPHELARLRNALLAKRSRIAKRAGDQQTGAAA